jgi:hypothetical protein
MAQLTVTVQALHSIFDDEGHMMSPGFEYKVKSGPLVNEHIENGLLTVAPEPEEIDAPAEDKKATTKPARAQSSAESPSGV